MTRATGLHPIVTWPTRRPPITLVPSYFHPRVPWPNIFDLSGHPYFSSPRPLRSLAYPLHPPHPPLSPPLMAVPLIFVNRLYLTVIYAVIRDSSRSP